MTTSVVTLNTSWQLVASGACFVTLAQDSTNSGGATLDSTPSYKGALVHIGTVLPADNVFTYHEVMDGLNYGGTQNVYMRTATGTQIIKVTPIV